MHGGLEEGCGVAAVGGRAVGVVVERGVVVVAVGAVGLEVVHPLLGAVGAAGGGAGVVVLGLGVSLGGEGGGWVWVG